MEQGWGPVTTETDNAKGIRIAAAAELLRMGAIAEFPLARPLVREFAVRGFDGSGVFLVVVSPDCQFSCTCSGDRMSASAGCQHAEAVSMLATPETVDVGEERAASHLRRRTVLSVFAGSAEDKRRRREDEQESDDDGATERKMERALERLPGGAH